MVKNLPVNARDSRSMGLIPGSGRSPGVGSGNPFQYFCLQSSMERGAQCTMVHGVAQSDMIEQTHTHTYILYLTYTQIYDVNE